MKMKQHREDDRGERVSNEVRGNRARVAAIWGAAFTLSAATVTLIVTLSYSPRPDTKPYELMKLCMQILGVVLVGAVVALASFGLQQRQLDETKKHERDLEDKKIAQRRADDRTVDERRRVDDLIDVFLKDTLRAYHAVKRSRRLLEAETGPANDSNVTRDVYLKNLMDICDQQLVFESLERRAPILEARCPSLTHIAATDADGSLIVVASLTEHYESVQKYLDAVVTEFQENFHSIADSGIPRAQLAYLNLLVSNTRHFRLGTSRRVTAVVLALESALLEPIKLSNDLRAAGRDSATFTR